MKLKTVNSEIFMLYIYIYSFISQTHIQCLLAQALAVTRFCDIVSWLFGSFFSVSISFLFQLKLITHLLTHIKWMNQQTKHYTRTKSLANAKSISVDYSDGWFFCINIRLRRDLNIHPKDEDSHMYTEWQWLLLFG